MKKLFVKTATITIFLTISSIAYNFDSIPNRISAYFVAPTQPLNSVKKKLINNGFIILATTNIFKDYNVITITNSELLLTNTYMATLHVGVSNSDVRVQNPSYFGAAFLKKRYKYGQFKKTINALEKALGLLHGSKQKANFCDLEEFNFMVGMPKVDDTIIIKKGKNLTSNIKNSTYMITLPNGNIIVGHKLKTRTKNFLKIINEKRNALLLPYESMIFKDKGIVQILDPKFYIALSLPNLNIEQFMEIASTPDEIENEIGRAYR